MVPETSLASLGEARNIKAGATSAGWPARPSGVSEPNVVRSSPSLVAGCSGVQIGPGATAFTLIPLGPRSLARLTVMLLIAAFVALPMPESPPVIRARRPSSFPLPV